MVGNIGFELIYSRSEIDQVFQILDHEINFNTKFLLLHQTMSTKIPDSIA